MLQMSADLIKQLREQTSVGIMDCKKALAESGNDIEKAIEYLRKKGLSRAASKADRVANEGAVDSYIHMNGKIGVLVEVNCETDFVARTDEFKQLVHDIAMHIAAAAPVAVSRDGIDPVVIEKERALFIEQLRQEGKPEQMIDKIVEGKVDKYYQQITLLEQPFIKNPDKTINDLVTEAIAKMGENVQIKRFARFALGEK
ncbi:MAG: translation elongation factor Ts [bacterium]